MEDNICTITQMQNQLPVWIKMLRFDCKSISLFFAIGVFMTFAANAQVTLTINAETRAVDFSGKWKAGDQLRIQVYNLTNPSFDSLAVTYRADEYTNTKGIAAFTEANAGPKALVSGTYYDLLPIMIQAKDVAYVTISLYTIKAKVTTKVDEQVYTHRVSGGLKFDVSMGAFITGLRNEAYALQAVSDSTNQIITERNGGIRVGTGILAHLHSRYLGWFNWGISGGFELNSDARVGYLAGLSAFIGYDRKFVITAGGVASKKSVLSAVYEPNDLISREITTVPMVEIWAGAWFVGLSYNF